MRIRFLAAIPALLLAGGLSGCDTTPQMMDGAANAVPPGKARLYFYRDATTYDGLQWTTVSLNGATVGAAAPGTVFYRDVAPGRYQVSARSDKLYPNQAKTVVLGPGTTTFVKVEPQPYWGQTGWLWFGNTFIVAVVDPAVGQDQISSLRLTPG